MRKIIFQVFTRKENYEKHACFTANAKIFNCQYCSKVFLEKKYLVRHLARHDKKYKCTACGKQYSSQKERDQHNCPSVPLSEKKVYPCQYCKKNFYRDLYLKRHIKNFHENKNTNQLEPKEKEAICEICAEKFSNVSSLKQHMAFHSEPRFECSVCNKKFYRKSVLDSHVLSHGSPQLPCDICGKKLKNKKSLDTHMLLHESDKPFSCSKCDKKFIQKMNLLRHEVIHQENVSETCEICNKTLTSKFALVAHQKTHEYQYKDHKCHSCEKSFAKKHLLKKHIVHTHLDKVYSCPYCSRIFKHRNSIRRHLNQSHKSQESEWNDPAVISSFFVDAKSLMNKNSTIPQETFIETKMEISNFDSSNTIESNNFDSNDLESNFSNTVDLKPVFQSDLPNFHTNLQQNSFDNSDLKSIDSSNSLEPNLHSNNLETTIELQSEINQSIFTNNLIETDQQITLGKNAFILDDGTIVQPQEEGNVMIYVLDQRFSNIFNVKSFTNEKNFAAKEKNS